MRSIRGADCLPLFLRDYWCGQNNNLPRMFRCYFLMLISECYYWTLICVVQLRSSLSCDQNVEVAPHMNTSSWICKPSLQALSETVQSCSSVSCYMRYWIIRTWVLLKSYCWPSRYTCKQYSFVGLFSPIFWIRRWNPKVSAGTA